ncbi:flavin reductase family protein [Occultella kanbiaonis]|uniref:flavin reductase family protein n=1 Tax=Occultella kanbiaonis TaxID=2675754 RepID=UPI0012B8451C|nr:flavin reductase family protein [Occultella kanbiaonis]
MTTTAPPGTAVTDEFRAAMAGLAAGVCVITTTGADGSPSGLTVSTGFSVSVTPPMFGLCVDVRSRTLPAVLERGAFVANVLHGGAQDVATLFASRATDKFARTPHRFTPGGLPWLAEHSLRSVECTITQTADAGDHVIILGAVDAVHAPAVVGGSALAYVDRRFHTLPRS